MKLMELTLLLHSAWDSFDSIHMSWEYSYKVDVVNYMYERYVDKQAFTNMAQVYTQNNVSNAARKTTSLTAWWRKPDCWRLENNYELTRVTSVGCRDKFETRMLPPLSAHLQLQKLNGDSTMTVDDFIDNVPLLDPSFLLTSHILHINEPTRYLGREAISVTAVYRKGKQRVHDAIFWTTADEYKLIIDAERGILLGYSAIIEQQEFANASTTLIEVDQLIPDEVFSL